MTRNRPRFWLLATLLLLLSNSTGAEPQPKAQQPPAGPPAPPAPPRIPRTAAQMIMADPLNGPTMLYQWCPNGSDEEYFTACLTINAALLQGVTPCKPDRICGGALVRVDLQTLCDNQEQLTRLLHLVREVAPIDEPFFHTTQRLQVKHGKQSNVETVVGLSPNVDPAMGIGKCFRVDQFAWRTMSQVDGGIYYQLRGLEPGKTKLTDYCKSRGFDYARALKNNTIDQTIVLSNVTSENRVIQLGRSEDGRPAETTGVMAITKDIKRGVNDPLKNPHQSLLNDDQQFFYEVLYQNPAGQQEGTLWDESQTLLSAADPEVATTNVETPFPKTLHGLVTCIGCHGPHSGYIPFDPRFSVQAPGSTRVLADISKKDAYLTAQAINSRFWATSESLKIALQTCRDSMDARYDFLRTKDGEHGYAMACAATTKQINYYKNSFVTPEKAASEWGFAAANGKTTVEAMREVLTYQPGVPTGEAPIVNQLLDGRSVARADFDFIYHGPETLAIAAIDKALEAKP